MSRSLLLLKLALCVVVPLVEQEPRTPYIGGKKCDYGEFYQYGKMASMTGDTWLAEGEWDDKGILHLWWLSPNGGCRCESTYRYVNGSLVGSYNLLGSTNETRHTMRLE